MELICGGGGDWYHSAHDVDPPLLDDVELLLLPSSSFDGLFFVGLVNSKSILFMYARKIFHICLVMMNDLH
jgi:hypothetical protein